MSENLPPPQKKGRSPHPPPQHSSRRLPFCLLLLHVLLLYLLLLYLLLYLLLLYLLLLYLLLQYLLLPHLLLLYLFLLHLLPYELFLPSRNSRRAPHRHLHPGRGGGLPPPPLTDGFCTIVAADSERPRGCGGGGGSACVGMRVQPARVNRGGNLVVRENLAVRINIAGGAW